MIGQMSVLLRLKELKQTEALRELQRRRAALSEAEWRRREAEHEVTESARTLVAREDEIFADILGRTVNLGDIDATHGRVAALAKAHGALEDRRERALHVEARLRGEAERQGDAYRAAVKVRDKYLVLTEGLRAARDAEIAQAEEIEVEDAFSRPRSRPA